MFSIKNSRWYSSLGWDLAKSLFFCHSRWTCGCFHQLCFHGFLRYPGSRTASCTVAFFSIVSISSLQTKQIPSNENIETFFYEFRKKCCHSINQNFEMPFKINHGNLLASSFKVAALSLMKSSSSAMWSTSVFRPPWWSCISVCLWHSWILSCWLLAQMIQLSGFQNFSMFIIHNGSNPNNRNGQVFVGTAFFICIFFTLGLIVLFAFIN